MLWQQNTSLQRRPVITNKNRWGNCLDANTNMPKIGSVWARAWAHSQGCCWALWDWQEWEKYQCSFYKQPKTNSRSTFTWKSTPSWGFLVFKPTLILQTGCWTFSDGFIQERGWSRPLLPVHSGLCLVQTHVGCRDRIFLPFWFHFRAQRDASSMFAYMFAFFASLKNHKLGRGFRKNF